MNEAPAVLIKYINHPRQKVFEIIPGACEKGKFYLFLHFLP